MSPTYLQTTNANRRAARDYGHAPVSSGCGSFRCQKCNLSAYLDTEPDPRWFQPCAPSAFTSAAAIRSHALNTKGGNGQRWFSKDAMRWHSTRLQRGTPKKGQDVRWYFVISNHYPEVGRRYAVCAYDASKNEVEQIDAGTLPHATPALARKAMAALVSGAK